MVESIIERRPFFLSLHKSSQTQNTTYMSYFAETLGIKGGNDLGACDKHVKRHKCRIT